MISNPTGWENKIDGNQTTNQYFNQPFPGNSEGHLRVNGFIGVKLWSFFVGVPKGR